MNTPTIHELEAILNSDEPQRVVMASDGSISVEPQLTPAEAAYGALWRIGISAPELTAARLYLLDLLGGKFSEGQRHAIEWACSKFPPPDDFDCWALDDAAGNPGAGGAS